MRSMLQVTDTLQTREAADQVLAALQIQEGYEFGRVIEPSGPKPGFRVQAFMADDGSYKDGSLENVRRVQVPEGFERLLRNDDARMQGNPVEAGSVWDGLSERELFLRRRAT